MFHKAQLLPLIIAVFVKPGQGKLVCEGDHHLRGNYCYFWGDNVYGDGTFETNEHMCNEYDATLVSIHDAEENAYVASLRENMHIGLHRVNNVLQWTDGSPVDYNNFAPDVNVSTIECIAMDNGIWYNTYSTDYAKSYVCKKKAIDVPETPEDQYPDPNTIYSDAGMIYSPGYPDYCYAVPQLTCTYKLLAQNGYKVIVEENVLQFSDLRGYIEFYDGWTATDDMLLSRSSDGTISTRTSNKMLIVFHGVNFGKFELEFFSEPLILTTPNPLITTPAPVLTPDCPLQNVYQSNTDLTSPGFPFAYDANTNCMYIFKFDASPLKTHWQFHLVALNLEPEDYINFVDLRTNAVFATTMLNLGEGVELKTDFPVAIIFRSGSVKGMFSHWRIYIINYFGS